MIEKQFRKVLPIFFGVVVLGVFVSACGAQANAVGAGQKSAGALQGDCGPVVLPVNGGATFQNPQEIVAKNGLLNATLVVTYANAPIGDCTVHLRSYNGKLVGPTLRIKPGDTISITLVNQLEPYPPNGQHDTTHLVTNTTNIHTHGLHVSPKDNSDNVLLEINPGETFQYVIKVPADHPPGTFWYHPHVHGSTAIQVSSGMEGALIIEGGANTFDAVPEIKAASAPDKEKIFVLQQIPFDQNGAVEAGAFGPCTWEGDPPSGSDLVNLTRTHTINGLLYPSLTMTLGEVQRWRLIHGGVRESISVELRGPNSGEDTTDIATILQLPRNDLHEIAVDGLALGKIDTWHDRPVDLAPGQRSDLLMQINTSGTYYLLDGPSPAEALTCPDKPEKPDLLAKVVVNGPAQAMALPASAQLKPYALPDIIQLDPTRLINPDTNVTSAVGAPPNPVAVVPVDGFQKTSFTIAQHGFSPQNAGGGGNFEFLAGERSFDHDNARKLTLNNTELWIMETSADSLYYAHPFHIHVNPFQTWRSGPDGLPEAIWRDTVLVAQGQKTYLYTTYKDFTGKFVYHCHILDHEDGGMMELLEVVQ